MNRLASLLEEIDKTLRVRILGALRQRFPGLTSEDLADAWAETLASVYQRTSTSVLSSTVENMEPLVRTMAYRRAVDKLRKSATRAAAMKAAYEELKEVDVSKQLDDRELIQRVKQEIALLPTMQRIVMQQLILGYPSTTSMDELCRQVKLATGKDTNIHAVKRNLHAARNKLRILIERKDD